MKLAPGRPWAQAAAGLAWAAACLLASPGRGQPFPVDGPAAFALNDAVRVDEIDSGIRSDLAQADELATAGQFSAALERYRLARQAAGNRLAAVDEGRRFVPVSELVALRLAAWPADGLAVARQQFDPLARPLLAKGLADRDPALLERVVSEYFVSSLTDEALLALGEIALEQGQPSAARGYWMRILPQPQATAGFASYPGPDADLAGVASRIALASLLAGDRVQARRDIGRLAEQFPTAMGTLGGRKGAYRALVEDLWTASADWPTSAPQTGWLTFAGEGARNAAAPAALEIGAFAWAPIPLANDEPPHRGAAPPLALGRKQGEFAAAPCSTYPIWTRLSGRDLLFFSNERSVFAVDVAKGHAAWSPEGPLAPIHTIPWKPATARRRMFGVPRHTLTVAGGLLLARMGAVGTYARGGQAGVSPSYLACLDLTAEGRLLWRTPAAERQEAFHRDGWSFDGPPVCDTACAYVALRRTDIRAQAFVECYELATGQRKWQTFVCAADTPGQGQYEEAACNLLSLAEDRLYFNTNQGVVASLAVADGRVLWASRYPRAALADSARPAGHFGRAPNPCVLHQGRAFVAPTDTPQVLAFDAGSGQLAWTSDERADDVRYLLGAHDGWLVGSGDRLHWLAADSGRRERSFPEGPGRLGCGRGLIAAGKVYWPTRGETDEIRVFDLQSGRQERVVDLSVGRGGQAGNLLAVGDHTVIAAHDALYCYAPRGEPPPSVDSRRTARAPPRPPEPEPTSR